MPSATSRTGPPPTAITAVHAATGLGDHRREAAALNNLGSALVEVGRFEEAITSHRQAADIYHKLRDHHGEGRALGNLGLALIEVRRLRDAREPWSKHRRCSSRCEHTTMPIGSSDS